MAAAKIKVIELAKELGVTSKDLMVAAEEMGHKGVRAMTPLAQELANELRMKLGKGRELPEEPAKAKRVAKPKTRGDRPGRRGGHRPEAGARQEDDRRDGRGRDGRRPAGRGHDRQAEAGRARARAPGRRQAGRGDRPRASAHRAGAARARRAAGLVADGADEARGRRARAAAGPGRPRRAQARAEDRSVPAARALDAAAPAAVAPLAASLGTVLAAEDHAGAAAPGRAARRRCVPCSRPCLRAGGRRERSQRAGAAVGPHPR